MNQNVAMDSSVSPIRGCLVGTLEGMHTGTVIDTSEFDECRAVTVKWHRDGSVKAVHTRTLRSGFAFGCEVEEVPRSVARKSLGTGYVVSRRWIAKMEQVLVHFQESGRVVWLPWQNLRPIQSVGDSLYAGRFEENQGAERFRLRTLARAIIQWDENTGALTRLSIDPLPHQINLVHHILASGNLNWMIADDVGLGKTIEVGMLLSALDKQRRARRVLLVTPAGLVRQWQEELSRRFGLRDFRVYGDEFTVRDPEHWKQHDRVIASIDRLKSAPHLESVLSAEPWDLIVFDEAHRLTRKQVGMKYKDAARFTLADRLRARTDSMLLLSATPHQGRQDQFKSLIRLLRPELGSAVERLHREPALLADMVYRNRKEEVTHMDGTRVFRGKIVRRIDVPHDRLERELDVALQRYFKQGYAAAARAEGRRIAAGFVMTMYRKLASSSIQAIHEALKRRLKRVGLEAEANLASELDADERFEGEREEAELKLRETSAEFFEGESTMLAELVERAGALLASDTKLAKFVELVRDELSSHEDGARIVIFTEYRETQKCLAQRLRDEFGDDSVALINGGQNVDEREDAIRDFENEARFLVSTEAGGEGLNMQRRCHIMVNYDLPWNPMRLVQRIGRLYRYGQERTVVVLNLTAGRTVDERIVSVMYERLDQVVADLAGLSDDYGEGLQSEWLGDVADLLDVGKVLKEAVSRGEAVANAAIGDAADAAREAASRQQDLFEYVAGFDADELEGRLAIDERHVRSFVLGMNRLKGLGAVPVEGRDEVWRIELDGPSEDEPSAKRPHVLATFDRRTAATDPTLEMIDMESTVLLRLLEHAKAVEFGGRCAAVIGIEGGSVMTAVLRWQNDKGARFREEFTAVGIDESGTCTINPDSFSEWLLDEACSAEALVEAGVVREWLQSFQTVCEDRLAELSTRFLHPESVEKIGAARLGILSPEGSSNRGIDR